MENQFESKELQRNRDFFFSHSIQFSIFFNDSIKIVKFYEKFRAIYTMTQ